LRRNLICSISCWSDTTLSSCSIWACLTFSMSFVDFFILLCKLVIRLVNKLIVDESSLAELCDMKIIRYIFHKLNLILTVFLG
jgi:hypothetical protein